jgi:hypothetical protein
MKVGQDIKKTDVVSWIFSVTILMRVGEPLSWRIAYIHISLVKNLFDEVQFQKTKISSNREPSDNNNIYVLLNNVLCYVVGSLGESYA